MPDFNWIRSQKPANKLEPVYYATKICGRHLIYIECIGKSLIIINANDDGDDDSWQLSSPKQAGGR